MKAFYPTQWFMVRPQFLRSSVSAQSIRTD